MNKKQHQQENIRRHSESLAALYKLTTGKPCEDALKLCKQLHSLELKAIRETTAQCNGVAGPQDDEGTDARLEAITNRVKKLFNGVLPEGYFINYDARGYALKIKNPKVSIHQDWGGYGILAPEF